MHQVKKTDWAHIENEWTKICPEDPSDNKIHLNLAPCIYFINTYCKILNRETKKVEPIRLWPWQWELLTFVFEGGRSCVLKGRRVGATLTVAKLMGLWKMLTYRGPSIFFQSVDKDAAVNILREMREIYRRLPIWMQEQKTAVEGPKDMWVFSDSTMVQSLSGEQGDSYEFNLGCIDEASLILGLAEQLGRIEPALLSIPNSQLILLSRANKRDPNNEFGRIYWLGDANLKSEDQLGWADWRSMFMPWYANVNFTEAIIDLERKKALNKDGHLDNFYESYPKTDIEALSPSTSDKRIPREWIMGKYGVFSKRDPIEYGAHIVRGLRNRDLCDIYHIPEAGKRYVIGVDVAEGLEGAENDNSAIVVVDLDTGCEVASLVGRYGPRDTAHDAYALSLFYNGAPILVERNNHGAATIIKLQDMNASIMDGPDDREGFLSTKNSKIYLYDHLAESFREVVNDYKLRLDIAKKENKEFKEKPRVMIHSKEIAMEIMWIMTSTLRATPGEKDDRADAYALAQVARTLHAVEGVIRADYTYL